MSIVMCHRTWRRRPSGGDQKSILARQRGYCFYCGIELGSLFIFKSKILCASLQWDHVLPFSFCFNNYSKNFAASCRQCNSIKASKVFNTIHEAIDYVRTKRFYKGLPLYRRGRPLPALRKRIPTEKIVAEVRQQEVPNGLLLGKPRNCAYCEKQFIPKQTLTKMCCPECCWQPQNP